MLRVVAQFEFLVQRWRKLGGPGECGQLRPKRLVVLVAAAVLAEVEVLEQTGKASVRREAADGANAFFRSGWGEGQKPFTHR